MTNSCWLRVSTFAHPNDFDATFSLWKSRGDHPLAFGIDIIVINSSKTINMTLGLQQQSREPIIVEVCQPLQRSLHKSYPQQFHLHVSRRWEFQVALCSNLQAWRRYHASHGELHFSIGEPPQVCPNNGCYKPYSGRNDHHSLSWNEAFGNSYPEPHHHFSDVTMWGSDLFRYTSPILLVGHNWLVVYLPLWKICSSVGKIIKMFQPPTRLWTIINHRWPIKFWRLLIPYLATAPTSWTAPSFAHGRLESILRLQQGTEAIHLKKRFLKGMEDWLVVQCAHLEKYEFVNGKDYPFFFGKYPNVWNHQPEELYIDNWQSWIP